MSTTYSVTVTIGRNVPQKHADAARRDGYATLNPDPSAPDQLSAASWQDFTDLVKEALETYAETIEPTQWWTTEQHDGVGEWDGVREESRKITLLFETQNGLPESARNTLVIDLLSARTGFYQDAVALSFGESVLV
jgi:hypothetical protein